MRKGKGVEVCGMGGFSKGERRRRVEKRYSLHGIRFRARFSARSKEFRAVEGASCRVRDQS